MDFYYIRHSIFNFLFVTHYINKWLISSKFFSLLTYHSTTPGPSELLSSLCVCYDCYIRLYDLLTYHSTTPGPSELLSSLCVCHDCYIRLYDLLTYHSTTPGPSELLSSLCVCHVCYHPFYFPHINLFYVRNGINLWAFFNIMFTFPLFTYLTKIRHLNIFHIHMKFKVLLSFGFTPLKKIQNFTQSWKIYLLI